MGTGTDHGSSISGTKSDASDHSRDQRMECIDRNFMCGASDQQHCRPELWGNLLFPWTGMADLCRNARTSQGKLLECGRDRYSADKRV